MAEKQRPTRTFNLSLNSEYATRSENGEYTFELTGSNPRVLQAALGTMELPPVQWVFEEEWSRVYFDEGVSLKGESRNVYDDDGEIVRLLPLEHNSLANPPEEQRRGDKRSLLLTTAEPHGWCAGWDMMLTPSGLLLHADIVQVVDDRSLRVLLPETAETAEIIDQQRRARAPAVVALRTYDEHAVMTEINTAVRRATGGLALQRDERGLVRADGYTGKGAVSMLTAVPSRGYAQLPLGTYGLQQLAQAVPAAFGGVDLHRRDDTPGPCAWLFTNRDGSATPVVLPSATMSLASLEAYINAGIGDQPYAPLALTCSGGLVSIAGRAVFGMAFGPKESVSATVLGFQSPSYEGCARYVAENPVHFPDFGISTKGAAPQRTYSLFAEQEQRRLGITASARTVVLKNGVVQNGAHVELEPGDYVYTEKHGYIRVDGVRVVSEKGAVALRLELEGVDGGFSGRLVSGCLQGMRIRAEPDPSVAPAAAWPHLLGFRGMLSPKRSPCAVLAPSSQVRHLAQGIFQLDHVPYVLVEIMNGTSSPSTMQRALLRDRTIFPFAKVCFVPYRVERQNPAEVQFPEGDRLGPVVLCLRNPNGSIYNTHNVPFTLSLTLVSSEP